MGKRDYIIASAANRIIVNTYNATQLFFFNPPGQNKRGLLHDGNSLFKLVTQVVLLWIITLILKECRAFVYHI